LKAELADYDFARIHRLSRCTEVLTEDLFIGSIISMNTASISQLKINPASVINQAMDYPVAVENRNKVQAYLIGKSLYEKMVAFIEDYIDVQAVKKVGASKGRSFEDVARELGL